MEDYIKPSSRAANPRIAIPTSDRKVSFRIKGVGFRCYCNPNPAEGGCLLLSTTLGISRRKAGKDNAKETTNTLQASRMPECIRGTVLLGAYEDAQARQTECIPARIRQQMAERKQSLSCQTSIVCRVPKAWQSVRSYSSRPHQTAQRKQEVVLGQNELATAVQEMPRHQDINRGWWLRTWIYV